MGFINNQQSSNKMIKSDLIRVIAEKQEQLSFKDVQDSIYCILEHMSEALENGKRIEIRGFGAFSLHKRRARLGRNPKTGVSITLPERYAPHFKPSKALRNIVDS